MIAIALVAAILSAPDAEYTKTLSCDITIGCNIETPPFEPIHTVLSTDEENAKPYVLSDGKTSPGAVKVTLEKSVRAEIDISTSAHTYRVDIVPDNSHLPSTASFVPPPPVFHPKVSMPPPVPTTTTETAFLDPGDIDWGYTSTGRTTCVAAFEVLSRSQIWCRLHSYTMGAPLAYLKQGRDEIPQSSRVTVSRYVLIDTYATPVVLYWSDGTTTTINRSYQ